MRLQSFLLLLGIFAGLGSAWSQGTSQARLLVDSLSVRPGDSFYAAVELTPPTGWHTYWRNPGDSGQATKISWTLPEGLSAGEILWPLPERLTEVDLTTYVYEGRVVLPVEIRVSPSRPAGPIRLQAKVSWLECKTECLPGKASLEVFVTVGSELKASPEASLIRGTIASIPTPGEASVEAHWTLPDQGNTRLFDISSRAPGFLDFFPFEDRTFEWTRKSTTTPGRVVFSVSQVDNAWPAQIRGLLVLSAAEGRHRAFEVGMPILDSPAPSTDSSSPLPTGGPAAPNPTPANAGGLLAMLGLAFLGGVILNIMPCVLPVIALKILGFVKQSGEAPGRVRFLGLVYTSGVLFSFGVLAALVIAVQSAGRTASWGMQFQNPVFLLGITTLVTLVALNLFGVFEVALHTSAMGTASQLASRKGASGAFFNGVFTTVLATPCTAPFLGAALGFAFGQPPLVLLVMFLSAGLGLATPYLLLSLQPSWLRFLPKPGNWMITFKVLMGFPMLATALWLLSLSADQFGDSGVFLVGMFLVCVSFSAWIFGQFIQTGSGNPKWSWGLLIVAALAGYFGILEGQLHWRSPQSHPTRTGGAKGVSTEKSTRDHTIWQPWTPEAVAKARTDRRPVLVDFTAKWCLTCRVNKAVAIDVPSVREKLASSDFITLRGDYTREDPAIAEELRRFERAGVPLVLVYPRNPELPPRILPSTLTEGVVLEALDWATR